MFENYLIKYINLNKLSVSIFLCRFYNSRKVNISLLSVCYSRGGFSQIIVIRTPSMPLFLYISIRHAYVNRFITLICFYLFFAFPIGTGNLCSSISMFSLIALILSSFSLMPLSALSLRPAPNNPAAASSSVFLQLPLPPRFPASPHMLTRWTFLSFVRP